MKKDIFQAIADPTRRAILLLLTTQSMTPNAIAAEFETTRQAVSKHIKILADNGLVTQDKKGREIHYSINPDSLGEIDKWLRQFKDIMDKRFVQLDDVLINLKQKK